VTEKYSFIDAECAGKPSYSVTRKSSYQNEEVRLALEQARLRQPGEPWLIPVRFDDCNVPDFELGAGLNPRYR
jgi:hypothetical protein